LGFSDFAIAAAIASTFGQQVRNQFPHRHGRRVGRDSRGRDFTRIDLGQCRVEFGPPVGEASSAGNSAPMSTRRASSASLLVHTPQSNWAIWH